jgi:TIR domain
MGRTKLFVSYSHLDADWIETLRMHLSVLERLGVVHIWSDKKIEAGAQWQTQIDSALKESRVAILMLSRAFLASEYIWTEEMPLIWKHQADRMLVLPLIVKPCAWQIEPNLSKLQARPFDGIALSQKSEAAADSALADFTYELARIIRKEPSVAQLDVRDAAATPSWLKVGRAWTGVYKPTNRQMRLVFSVETTKLRVRGTIEYVDTGTITGIEGRLLTSRELEQIVPLKLGESATTIDGALTFKETNQIQGGTRSADLSGEYIAAIRGRLLRAAWMSPEVPPQEFDLVCHD